MIRLGLALMMLGFSAGFVGIGIIVWAEDRGAMGGFLAIISGFLALGALAMALVRWTP